MEFPNAFERAIFYLSPSWAAQRQFNRLRFQESDALRKYSGAARNPLTADWFAQATSARAEVNGDLATLRNRMRELVRNDGWAYAAMNILANNIVGAGIQPMFTAPDSMKAAKEKAQAAFMAWCGSTDADFYENNTFWGLQDLLTKDVIQSGNCFVIKRYKGEGAKVKLCIQVVECDFLVDWYCVSPSSLDPKKFPAGTYVENGIYFDETGKVIGYELYKQHPGDSCRWGDSGMDHFFISSKDCVLVYRADRPGQHMGVPTGHSVMLDHKMLHQYEVAQAHKQTVSALFAIFIKSSSPPQMGHGGKNSSNPPLEDLSPGTIQYLNVGEDISSADPPKIDGFDEYVQTRIRKISRGWGLSYEALSGDLKQTSFSSGRMGQLQMKRNIQVWQHNVIIPKFCNVVASWWIELERLRGSVPVNASELKVSWTPPRIEMIDPLKETTAYIDQMLAGMTSLTQVIRENGGDPATVLAEIKSTNDILDSLGLLLGSDYRRVHEQKMKTNSNEKPPA